MERTSAVSVTQPVVEQDAITLPELKEILKSSAVWDVSEDKDSWLTITLESGFQVMFYDPSVVVVHPNPS